MSDFIRRASDAFHRQRQDSTGSTGSNDEPTSPNAAKPPEQESMRKAESATAASQTKDAVAGTKPNDADPSKHRRHWPWGSHHPKDTEPKQQSSHEQRDNDWVFGS